MTRSSLLLLCCLCLCLCSTAQKTDSLKRKLYAAEADTLRVMAMIEIAAVYKGLNPDSAHIYAQKARQLARKINFRRGEAGALMTEGEMYDLQLQYNKALECRLAGLAIYEEIKSIKGIAMSYHNIGNSYYALGRIDDAIKYYNKKLDLLKKNPFDYKSASQTTLGSLGMCYKAKNDYAKAIACFGEGLQYAIEAPRAVINKLDIISHQTNLGETYYEMGNYNKALEYYLAAQEVAKETDGNYDDLILIGLGQIYTAKQEYEKAIKLSREGLELARQNGNTESELYAYENLVNACKGKEDFKTAFFYFGEFTKLKDSIATQMRNDELARMISGFEDKEKDKEISLLKEKERTALVINERNRLYIIVAITGCLFFALLVILIVYRNKARKKQQKLKLARDKAEFEQQAIRAQMNPHFIFNALNSIQHYILTNETQYAYDYLARFSRLIRQVLMNSEQGDITLKDELELLHVYIDLEQRRFRNRFDYTIECAEQIPAMEIRIPSMLVQPFVENAIWHGIMHLDRSVQGLLTIRFALEEPYLKISVEDNGVGRTEAARRKTNEEHQSSGTSFTRKRIELLQVSGGQPVHIEIIDLKNESGDACGTRVEIHLPV
ncbi:MAG: hypothetical protein K0S33_1424 [Bacteroidetes bacterium]|jgi:tetratricopeptide (TPR) repeat protein|nr:hypothetical protein [Bacteroidota bacterium]